MVSVVLKRQKSLKVGTDKPKLKVKTQTVATSPSIQRAAMWVAKK